MGRKNNRRKLKIPGIRQQSRFIVPQRMEIWFAKLDRDNDNSVICGNRPVIVVSNEQNNRYANTITVIPITGSLKRLDLPSHVDIGNVTALTEQITTIDKKCLDRKLGYCGNAAEIEKAVTNYLGL